MSNTYDTNDSQKASTSTESESDDGSARGMRLTSRPTLKPVGIALGATVAITALIVGVLVANPTLLGAQELTEVALWVVMLVAGFAVLRLLVRMYVLSRMRYVVSGDGVAREYSLLYRYQRREVPIKMVRGIEVARDPIETLLGFGTVSILSGGTNQSLGFVKFEHVPNPERVTAAIERYQDDA